MLGEQPITRKIVAIPTWAPRVLLEFSGHMLTEAAQLAAETAQSDESDDEGVDLVSFELDLIFKLLTDKRMESTWAALLKRLPFGDEKHMYPAHLFDAIFDGALAPPEWERTVPTERKKWLTEMRSACQSLRDGLDKFPSIYIKLCNSIERPTLKES